MDVVLLPIDSIKPYKRNPRKNDKAVAKLKSLLESGEVPYDVPIVIDKNKVIVKGHTRWRTMKELGEEFIPVIMSENSDELNDKDRITDNAVQDLSKWKPEELSIELRELDINLDGFELPNLQSSMYSNKDEDYASIYATGVSGSSVESAISKMLGIADEKKTELIEWKCDSCGETFFISRKEVEEWG